VKITTVLEFGRKHKMLRQFRICLKKRIWWRRSTPVCWGCEGLDGYHWETCNEVKHGKAEG
jgi:hypothetical protein